MSKRVLVTGATGNVGSEVLRRLAGAGVSTAAAVRKPGADGDLFVAEQIRLDFEVPNTFRGAVAGVERIFLVRPPAISDVRSGILPFLDAAQEANVRHVVFLSLLGAERNRFVPHRAIEEYLRASEMDWTFLRAGFFMRYEHQSRRRYAPRLGWRGRFTRSQHPRRSGLDERQCLRSTWLASWPIHACTAASASKPHGDGRRIRRPAVGCRSSIPGRLMASRDTNVGFTPSS